MAAITNANTAHGAYSTGTTSNSGWWSWDTTTSTLSGGYWNISGSVGYESPAGTGVELKYGKKGVHPQLVFKLWKKKLSVLGNMRYKRRVEKLKKLLKEASLAGQDMLAEKFRARLAEEIRLAEIYAAGIRRWLEKSMISKYRSKVRDGHIADTLFGKYTQPIPTHVLKRKRELEKLKIFDEYVIYHYWNEELEEKKDKKEPRTSAERAAMKDPILFGMVKEIPDKLFFIADWDDEYCDLTFSELVDALPAEEKRVELPKEPDLKERE